MAINLINTGATANDGTGDVIRNAFDTVNDNFDFINGGLFAGTQSSIISAVSVTAGYIYSNTWVNANSIVSNTITSAGNLTVQSNGALIFGNVTIFGNLTVSGTQLAQTSQNSSSPILQIHYSATPLVTDDAKDIGLEWQYYEGAEFKSFLGWQNSTRSLVYLDDITDSANIITAGTPGNVQFGSLLLSNTTSSISNVTGALKVSGGASVAGNLYVAGNVVSTFANIGNLSVTGYHIGNMNFAGADTIYINGSPVQTAAQAFDGGTIGLATIFNDTTQSTSAVTGAVTVKGGIGVAGNVWAGNLQANIGGNVRANVQGNIFTAAQPYITSLGTLTGLSVQGQINSRNIVPETNLTYTIGSSTSTRYSKIWAFDTDFSGAMTLAGVLTTTANIAINTGTAAAVTTTTAVGELFNTTATTVRIGGDAVTQFGNNTKATSTTTGAVQVTGGISVATGNLYIGGSAGKSIDATGAVKITNSSAVSSSSPDLSLYNSTGFFSFVANASAGAYNPSTRIGDSLIYFSGNGGSNNANLTITPWADYAAGLRIVSNGAVIVSNTASATSDSTGALIIKGGAGITGNVYTAGWIIPSANTTQDLGSTTNWWGTLYGVSTQAQYADLAENYVADDNYEIGTVVVFGGDAEITVTNEFADHRVAGVISANPAYLMNAAVSGLPVALRGRVLVRVSGPVAKGDLLVTSTTPGYARSVGSDTGFGVRIFAKSLEVNTNNGTNIIEAVIL